MEQKNIRISTKYFGMGHTCNCIWRHDRLGLGSFFR